MEGEPDRGDPGAGLQEVGSFEVDCNVERQLSEKLGGHLKHGTEKLTASARRGAESFDEPCPWESAWIYGKAVHASQEQRDALVLIRVDVPAELHAQLWGLKLLTGRNITDTVSKALAQYIDKHSYLLPREP